MSQLIAPQVIRSATLATLSDPVHYHPVESGGVDLDYDLVLSLLVLLAVEPAPVYDSHPYGLGAHRLDLDPVPLSLEHCRVGDIGHRHGVVEAEAVEPLHQRPTESLDEL